MIIKSHIRGGYRAAADYMKNIGENEKTRVVEMSDPSAENLDDAFQNMWVLASGSRCKKPLHHVSINPMKDERLTDEQVLAIVERAEEVYGYELFHHQRVIIEHVKEGRQHFHVIWIRVSLTTGKAVWPGLHWEKSKQIAREMEEKLGLKKPGPKSARTGRSGKGGNKKPARNPSAAQRTATRGTKTALGPKGTHTPGELASNAEGQRSSPTPARPVAGAPGKKEWPVQAIIDWKDWGHKNPRWFFTVWLELVP